MKKFATLILTLAMTLNGITAVFAAQWQQDQNGWWYDYENGDYAKSKWEQIDGNWYLFGSGGYMLTGWQNIGGNWYYLLPGGAMATNTVIDGYQLGTDGIMLDTSQNQTSTGTSYDYAMEISAGKNTDILKMQFTNYSSSDMKLVNGDNHTFSNLDSKYDRDMNLCDASGSFLNSFTIRPGETEMVYYKLSSTSWYDSRQNVMVVGIEHDGEYTLLYANIFDVPVN